MTPPVRLAALAVALSALAEPTAAAEPYIDKVLEEGPQPKLLFDAELSSASGWLRGWRVEYNTARDSGSQRGSSDGVAVSGFVDTPDYGALSANAAFNRTRGADGIRVTNHLWRIDQTALPLNGGWLANHSAGDLASLQVPMSRGFGRIGLPSSPLEGVNAQYLRGVDTAINFSAGRPGLYSGRGVNSFDSSGGSLAFAGAQHGWGASGDETAIAMQLAHATDSLGQRADGAWGAWRWQGKAPWAETLVPGPAPTGQREGGLDLQVNAMTSRSEPVASPGPAGKGVGAWVDARWRSGWLTQQAGAFYLEPGLRWGSYNAISDLRGLYWQGDIVTRQWQFSGSAELADSVSATTAATAYASLNGRYRVDTRNGLLGGFALRRQRETAESAQLGWERLSDWGQTQVRADVLHAQARRAMRTGIDHSFSMPLDSSLALSLAYERANEAGRILRSIGWGVIGSVRPLASVTLDAGLRGVVARGARQFNGTVGLNWAINTNWNLLGQLSSSTGEEQQGLALESSLTQAAALTSAPASFSARRVQLTLRYEERAGRAVAPIGGVPGGGAGGISGVVYFDTNTNSRREASEAGVPDVTIRLNGRFVTRTDAQGRYEFPAVAAGTHRLEIVTDNIPLPWSPAQTGPQPMEVLVRSTSVMDFALRRDP
jgi:hypothetical protein